MAESYPQVKHKKIVEFGQSQTLRQTFNFSGIKAEKKNETQTLRICGIWPKPNLKANIQLFWN
jgi:hypothetical protein